MALAMATRAPELWTAVSAWAPISDLAAWHRERANDPTPTIARQIVACVGGAPGATAVSTAEMQQLSRVDGRLTAPRPGDEARDPAINRDVFLRRTAGPSRVTVYDGGHEMDAGAAFASFDAHAKP